MTKNVGELLLEEPVSFSQEEPEIPDWIKPRGILIVSISGSENKPGSGPSGFLSAISRVRNDFKRN